MTLIDRSYLPAGVHFAATPEEFQAACRRSSANDYLFEAAPFGASDEMLAQRPLCRISALNSNQHFYIQDKDGVMLMAAEISLSGEDRIAFEHMAVHSLLRGHKSGLADTGMRAVMAHCMAEGKLLESIMYDAPNTEGCMYLYGKISPEFPDLGIVYPGIRGIVRVAEKGPYEIMRPYNNFTNIVAVRMVPVGSWKAWLAQEADAIARHEADHEAPVNPGEGPG